MTTPDYAVSVTFSAPTSLAVRLDAEQQRQGIRSRSVFLRLLAEAYLSVAEANAAVNDGILTQ